MGFYGFLTVFSHITHTTHITHIVLDHGDSSLAYSFEKQECALDVDSAYALYRGGDELDYEDSSMCSEDILEQPSTLLPLQNNNLPQQQYQARDSTDRYVSQ
jgi:hypothetical protein